MLFVAVHLTLVSIVVRSLFVLIVVLVPHIGTMALLYYLNFLIHIILAVVVLQVMASIVERFMFMPAIASLIATGALALLYHMTSYYSNRGGLSGFGFHCGVFCVLAGSASSYAAWTYGAALDYYFILCSSWWSFR